MKTHHFRILAVLLLFVPFVALAQIRLPKAIGNDMVLQQGTQVNIWGYAPPHENITVKFQKQTKKTKADNDGSWSIMLDELSATKVPQQLIISGKKGRIVLKKYLDWRSLAGFRTIQYGIFDE